MVRCTEKSTCNHDLHAIGGDWYLVNLGDFNHCVGDGMVMRKK